MAASEVPSAVVLVHLLAIVPALGIGAWQLLRAKGDRTHRLLGLLGRVWGGLMTFAALSRFFIQFRGRLSWLHGLAVLTLVALARGVHGSRAGNIRRHQRNMVLTYLGSLLALIFALTPGRMLGDWLRGLL